MAQHIKLDQDKDTLILDVAKTALRTAKSAQTRKSGSAFYPTGDGQGVLVGGMADHGVDKWDPATGEQNPLWEGISQEELDAKADEILGAAKEDTAAQITIVNTTITEAQKSIKANSDGLEQEASLRAEGDKLAQEAAKAVKEETDRLSKKYDTMDTDVKSVKSDLTKVMSSTTQLEQDMIVSTLIEYAVGDSDTTPPDVTTYWMGEPNNSVSVLSDPWGPTTPERTPGTYIWMRTRVTFGDGGQETSAPVLVTGNTGAQGPQGVAGAKGDKGDDGITRYSYFAYGTSASGANFSTTPTSASTYIGVCVTTAATQPTDPTKYTWSLTKGATGPAGPQGAAGAKGDVGEDGKTYYTYFAYGTSASGANFSTTPTANSTYMGVCITLSATQPTTPASYTWSLTKGNQGATGPQGVSVSALTPFWQLSESKPAQPVNKSPGGGWSSSEPAYVRGKKLWTCSRIDYSNGQWSWTSVQQSSAFEAAELALTTANGKNRRFVQPTTPVVDTSELTQGDEWWQTSSKPPETYWMGTPNNSVSVLVDHSDEVEHIWVWNGTRWTLNRLSAEDILVSGSVAAGLVTADFFDGAIVKGGAFITSNERIQLNNEGFTMVDSSGNPVVTLDAKTGEAILQSVNIIGAGISTPTVVGGSIEGADYKLTAGTGENKQIVAQINSSGVMFGDHLAYAKNSKGKWVLSLKGTVQAGGTVSGAHVKGGIITTNTSYDPDDPAWEFDYVETDPAKAAVKYRGVWITSGGLFAYKGNGKEEYSMAFTAATGELKLDGAVAANASLTGATINGGVVYGATVTTNPNYASTDPTLRDRGVWIKSNGLVAYDADGKIAVRIDATTGALYAADGVNTNGTFNIYDTDGNITVNLGPGTFGIYKPSTEIDPRRFTYLDADNHNHRRLSLWGENGITYNTQTGWDSPQINPPCVDMGLQKSVRGGLLVYRGRVKCPNSGDNIISTDTAYNSDHSITGLVETYGTNRSAVAVGFRNNTAQPCIVYIPANTRQLVAVNGPWDWVDLTGVTFGQ